MAKVNVYKNSKLATVLSFLGYIAIVIGVYSFFQDDISFVVGIILLAIGFIFKFLASLIDNRKNEKNKQEDSKK